jgi:hypothetical protein
MVFLQKGLIGFADKAAFFRAAAGTTRGEAFWMQLDATIFCR